MNVEERIDKSHVQKDNNISIALFFILSLVQLLLLASLYAVVYSNVSNINSNQQQLLFLKEMCGD